MTDRHEAHEIAGDEGIATLFSLLHDGVIVDAAREGDELALRVEIRYLTMRIDPSFRHLMVRLRGMEALRFSTWPKAPTASPETWSDVRVIPRCRSRSSKAKRAAKVSRWSATSPRARPNTAGGTLLLRADAAIVVDEAGTRYTLARAHHARRRLLARLARAQRAPVASRRLRAEGPRGSTRATHAMSQMALSSKFVAPSIPRNRRG